MPGWGILPWGTGPWGLASFSLVSARALTTHSVLVQFGAPVKAIASYVVGDALNPSSWVLTNTITGQVFTILSIGPANSLNMQMILYTLEALGPFEQLHLVNAASVLSANGNSLLPPTSLTFPGVEAIENASTAVLARTVDLENTGAYRITSAGDYAEQLGGSITRKLILRRLTTQPGGFFFLDNYGLGIRIKEPVTTAGLIKLKAEIERQVLLEPEVTQVSAVLTLGANGVVFGVLKARLARGTDTEEIPFNVRVQF